MLFRKAVCWAMQNILIYLFALHIEYSAFGECGQEIFRPTLTTAKWSGALAVYMVHVYAR